MWGVHRRRFLCGALAGAAAAVLPVSVRSASGRFEFEISLTELSFARSLAKNAIDHLDLTRVAKAELGISAVEYASGFFRDHVQDDKYLEAMNVRAADQGVRQLLIMVDGEGHIGDADANRQQQAVQRHRRWIDAAKALGCHSIQIDPTSSGNVSEQQQRVVAGLRELCQYSAKQRINVLLGNYGGASAGAAWIAAVVKEVDLPCCGTLPQIGGFTPQPDHTNLDPVIPFAKGITAITTEFDDQGWETHTDYAQAMKVVYEAGYRGYVGIHFAGKQLDDLAGIRATKRLLERVRGAMNVEENARS